MTPCGTGDDTGAAMVLNDVGDDVSVDDARKRRDSCRHDVYGYDDNHSGGDNSSSDNAEIGADGCSKGEHFPSAEAHCGGSRRGRGKGDNAEQRDKSCATKVYAGSSWRITRRDVGPARTPNAFADQPSGTALMCAIGRFSALAEITPTSQARLLSLWGA